MDLNRLRPWIIVIEATEPLFGVSTRSEWEYLVTGRSYGLAYFDGLNCFYVADEGAGLKERLAVPPNCFDGFVRWPEWFNGRRAATLEREVAALRELLGVVRREAFNPYNALQREQAQTGRLLSELQAKQAETNHLQEQVRQLEAQQAFLVQRLPHASEG